MVLFTVLVAAASLASAQTPALTAAKEAFNRAEASPVDATPDVPVWSDAIDAAEHAVSAATTAAGQEAALRHLARTLQAVAWWIRAETAWNDLSALRGGLDDDDLQARAEVRTQLAYAHFERGNLEAARTKIDQALSDVPEHLAARRLQARLDLEQGRVQDAVRRWQSLAERLPDDPEVAYGLRIAEERQRWGLAASQAYRRGLAQSAAGDFAEAQAAFAAASNAAPDWDDPAINAVTAALNAGDRGAVVRHVTALEARFPEHPRLGRLKQAAMHATEVGVDAALAYQQALTAYDAGDMDAAITQFTALAGEQPSWAAPWAQIGQIHFNRSAWGDAADAFERASERDPDDTSLAFFAQQARTLAGPEGP
jgi:tetratricopeptide (TPR) repeat protein